MSLIKILANEIIDNMNLTVPIDLNKICECYGIKILYRNITGADGYFILARKKIIIKNSIKGTYKERFTIAHELGHYLNLNDKTYELDVYNYNENPQKWKNKVWEREADEFASELLMPERFIKTNIENIDIKDWEMLNQLSVEYEVSLAAILIKYVNNSYGNNRIACYYNNKLIWQYGNDFKYNISKNILNDEEIVNKYARKYTSEWLDGEYEYTDEVLIDKGNIKYLLININEDD